jgi:hypothetical protein
MRQGLTGVVYFIDRHCYRMLNMKDSKRLGQLESLPYSGSIDEFIERARADPNCFGFVPDFGQAFDMFREHRLRHIGLLVRPADRVFGTKYGSFLGPVYR